MLPALSTLTLVPAKPGQPRQGLQGSCSVLLIAPTCGYLEQPPQADEPAGLHPPWCCCRACCWFVGRSQSKL